MPMFLISVILLTIWFTFARKRSSALQSQKTDTFWENESNANHTRKISLECLDYITIPLNLPELSNAYNDSFVIEYCNTLRKLSQMKIVNLTGISNTDLKMQYGSSNLPVLSQYDENYTTLVTTLHQLGQRFFELEELSKAIMVLEFAVSVRTDVSLTYQLLAKLYISTNQSDKIDWLKQSANSLNTIMKSSILSHLNALT